MLTEFNSSFYNNEFYRDKPRHQLISSFETNRECKDSIYHDVITFFTSTDVAKMTGLSVMDVMKMYYDDYIILKKHIANIINEKTKLMQDELRKQEEFKKQQKTRKY